MKKILYIIPILVLGLFFAPKFSHAATSIIGLTAPSGATTSPEIYTAFTNVPAGTVGTTTWWSQTTGTYYGYVPMFSLTADPNCTFHSFHSGLNSSYASWDYGGAGCLGTSYQVSYGSADAIASTTIGGITYTEFQHYFNVSTTPDMIFALDENNYSFDTTPVGTIGDTAITNTNEGFACERSTGAASCDSTNVQTPFINFSSVPASGVSLNILYPTEGLITPLFSNFVFSSDNVTTTHQYQISIDYQAPQSNLFTGSVQVSGAQLKTYGAAIPFLPTNFNVATSAAFFAVVTLYDVTNFQIPENLAQFSVFQKGVNFTVMRHSSDPNVGTTTFLQTLPFSLGGGGVIVSTSTTFNPYPLGENTTSTLSLHCGAPSSILDVGGGILWAGCSLANFLLVPNNNITTYWASGLTNIQNAFPFSVVFGVHNILTQVASTTATAGENTQYTAALSLAGTSPVFPSSTPSITFLSSSTLIKLVGQSKKDLIFGLEDAFMWVMFAFAVYEIVAHGKHK